MIFSARERKPDLAARRAAVVDDLKSLVRDSNLLLDDVRHEARRSVKALRRSARNQASRTRSVAHDLGEQAREQAHRAREYLDDGWQTVRRHPWESAAIAVAVGALACWVACASRGRYR